MKTTEGTGLTCTECNEAIPEGTKYLLVYHVSDDDNRSIVKVVVGCQHTLVRTRALISLMEPEAIVGSIDCLWRSLKRFGFGEELLYEVTSVFCKDCLDMEQIMRARPSKREN